MPGAGIHRQPDGPELVLNGNRIHHSRKNHHGEERHDGELEGAEPCLLTETFGHHRRSAAGRNPELASHPVDDVNSEDLQHRQNGSQNDDPNGRNGNSLGRLKPRLTMPHSGQRPVQPPPQRPCSICHPCPFRVA
jgi:hypothetical protein